MTYTVDLMTLDFRDRDLGHGVLCEVTVRSAYCHHKHRQWCGRSDLAQLVTLLEHGSIEARSAFPCAWPRPCSNELVIVSFVECAPVYQHRGKRVVLQEAKLAALQEQVGDAGCRYHADVPSAALTDIRQRLETITCKAQ